MYLKSRKIKIFVLGVLITFLQYHNAESYCNTIFDYSFGRGLTKSDLGWVHVHNGKVKSICVQNNLVGQNRKIKISPNQSMPWLQA